MFGMLENLVLSASTTNPNFFPPITTDGGVTYMYYNTIYIATKTHRSTILVESWTVFSLELTSRYQVPPIPSLQNESDVK